MLDTVQLEIEECKENRDVPATRDNDPRRHIGYVSNPGIREGSERGGVGQCDFWERGPKKGVAV